MDFDKSAVDEVIARLHIQPVGNGYIDMICPTENINLFIDEMNRLNIKILGFTWWCLSTQTHKPCGCGGPQNEYGEGWYSEIISEEEILLFDNNEEVRNFLINEYPKNPDFKPCYHPGFWLEEPVVSH